MIARRPAPHVHVLGPVLLIAAGAVALLITSGQLAGEEIDRLIGLWPLVIVLLGLQVVFAHLLAGRLSALVAVVAMLAVVALGLGYALLAPAASTARVIDGASAPSAGVTAGTLRLDGGGGTVLVRGLEAGADLYRARIVHAARAEPTVEATGGTVHVAMGEIPWLRTPRATEVELAMDGGVPWNVTVGGAGLRAQADLRDLVVSGLALKGVGSRLDVLLPAEPVGEVTVSVDGVGSDLTLRIPRAAGVTAVVDGLGTGFTVDGVARPGRVWSRPGRDSALGHYEIRVAGVGSHVRLEMLS